MSKRKYKGYKRSKLNYGDGTFLMVSDAVRSSIAYRSLTNAHRLVFLDMMGAYMKASKGDTRSIDDSGFTYTFEQCRERIARATFYRATREIVKAGFFTTRPDLQPMRGGEATIYGPSCDWTKLDRSEAGTDARAKVERSERAKQLQIKRDRLRRGVFYRRLPSDKDTGPLVSRKQNGDEYRDDKDAAR